MPKMQCVVGNLPLYKLFDFSGLRGEYIIFQIFEKEHLKGDIFARLVVKCLALGLNRFKVQIAKCLKNFDILRLNSENKS